MHVFGEQFDSYLVVCVWFVLVVYDVQCELCPWLGQYEIIVQYHQIQSVSIESNAKATLYWLHLQDVQCEILSVNRDENTRIA